MGDPVVTTTKGRLRGRAGGGVLAFLGIPYGADTAGANRWRPPQPVAPWEGVRDATELGPICPQPTQADDGRVAETQALFGGGDPTGAVSSEDCLRLNVWTPSVDPAPGGGRPVLVWMHGGAYLYGMGTGPGANAPTHGAALAAGGDAVVVTLNNRLGILGHLHLAELFGADYAASGNTGLLDMTAALEWVRDEIASFGGDPARVLVFGESGGGSKAHTLATMPRSRPLMTAIACQSGFARQFHTPASATEVAKRLVAEIGTDDLAALQALPVERLVAVQQAEQERTGSGAIGLQAFYPVVDGSSLPVHPRQAGVGVPVLLGSNKDEVDLVISVPEDLDDTALEQRLRALEGDRTEALLAAYRRSRPSFGPADLFREIQTERLFRIPALDLADELAAGGTPVWTYWFAYDSPVFAGRKGGAPHAMDIPFVFRTVDAVAITGDRDDRLPVADAMSRAWVALAANGDPNHPGLPTWPRYRPGERATMIFDTTCRVELDWRADERRAWRSDDHDDEGDR